MVTGWRRAFCTSIPKEDRDTKLFSSDKHQQPRNQTKTSSNSSSNFSNPRISSKFGFFSTPSTPRLRSQPPVSSPSLRCRTAAATAASASVPNSPKLQCKTAPAPTPKKSSSATNSPRLFHLSSSNPTSPKSPSSFSLLRASLRLSRTRCGICLQSAKAGQGTAIFTAECSHTFHFPCVAAHVKKHRILVCPVCSTTWKELPLLDDSSYSPKTQSRPKLDPKAAKGSSNAKPLRAYDDDESLLSPSSVSRFNPIPESDESNEDSQQDEPVEFQGFFVGSAASPVSPMSRPPRNNLEVSLLPEAAIVSVNKSYVTYAVVLKVKAPPALGIGSPPRAPVDLVTVLDVSACMNGDKLHVMKRAMRLVISSLSDTDRLSIVAFSATSKRLLPLRRMNVHGRRSARRIVDAIGCTGQHASVNDALRKAAKVLEDRREKNPVSTIMLLSDGHDQRIHATAAAQKRSYPLVTSTRIGDVPVHAVGFGAGARSAQEEAFAKCLTGLLSVAVQDLRLQLGFISGSDPAEITAVYSLIGRPSALGSRLIRVGDLYADEERELLVELKVRDLASGSHHVMSVGSSYKDPPSQEFVYSKEQPVPVPRPQAVRSPSIQRLKNLHVTARAIAESRRLVDRGDLSGAHHLLSSARALLVQSGLGCGDEFLRCLEGELTELQKARQAAQRQRMERREGTRAEEKTEALTPTSAWRAAERLAKVAIMRKSMNRVSDLHGFENARF
ncbi:E3 ubiquitin-protein ligase WAVH1-like [Punica granatum]|uniref:Uncharacterized protein n=2 Tax=Punica granatum TaxID=22663 RepID=A0A218XLU9_PUNGR|nr:E3 ubiquitin-protein ligase WAVH1-like [Punica granatum]OWM85441.1 hypothetical protein CDL15_Pgr019065 [Punica granatum]PKI42065.1 hypothetical protein CRG98_037518 [Punica granatum]